MRNFLRIYQTSVEILHLKPVFERKPTEGLNDDLPVGEVVGEVDSLEVARGSTVAAPHARLGHPAGVQAGAAAQTPGAHRSTWVSHHLTSPRSLAQSLT